LALVPLVASPQGDERVELEKQHRPPGKFLPEATVLRI